MVFENWIFIANERKSVAEMDIIWTTDMQNEPILYMVVSPTNSTLLIKPMIEIQSMYGVRAPKLLAWELNDSVE